MGNRKQPFGYRMQFGEVVKNPPEAELVQRIFEKYLLGASLQALTDALRDQEIPYEVGKLWNKNMVARILGDRRYCGQPGYPKLIDTEAFEAATENRTAKAPQIQISEAQKVLRRLCDTTVTHTIQEQVRQALNHLIDHPQLLRPPAQTPVHPEEANRIQKSLDDAMAQQPIDEPYARSLIMALAAAQYAQLGTQDYETERIRYLLRQAAPMEELDAALLRETVAAIHVTKSAIELRLKNGQMIQREV